MISESNNKLEVAGGLKRAMRRMPSAVALITTADPKTGHPAGLVVSAVIPVSMDPPSMLVSVNSGASVHPTIASAGKFCVNLLSIDQDEIVKLFANAERRAERFVGNYWSYAESIPYLPQAYASIFCDVRLTTLFGTHEMFIGEVSDIRENGRSVSSLAWVEGNFAQTMPLQLVNVS